MTKNTHLTTLTWLLLLSGSSAVCVFCAAGCSESSQVGSGRTSRFGRPKTEFQDHGDRLPTARTLYAMADILATQGKDAECEFVLVRCVREHPRFVPAYNGLAELQMRHGRVSQAAKVLSWALRINPRDPVLLNNFGMCWLIQRDYEKALVYFTRAAEMAPRNARYQANVAVAQGLMGRYDDSLSSLTRVMPEDQAKHNLQVLREAGKDAGTGKVVTN